MRAVPFRRQAGIHQQKGALGLYLALVLVLMVLFTALAVDTGRLAMEKQRLQTIADLSALHAAGEVACGGSELPDSTAVAAAAQQVAGANGYQGDLSAEAGGVTLGTTQTVAGIRQFSAPVNPANADSVQVLATSDFPSSLILPAMIAGNTRLQASAVASKRVLAGFQLGSFLAGLNTGDSVLNPLLGGMLGSNLSLDLVSYQGIATAQVSLLNLIDAAANVGTVDELLNSQMSVASFLNLLINAVGSNTTAGIALNDMLSAGVGVLPDITLGDIVAVIGDDPQAALDAQINTFDLLNATLQLANQQHVISIPNFNLNIPPLASVGFDLYVIEPPKIAIGPPGKDQDGNWRTETRTGQLRLQLNASALDLDLGLVTTAVNLSLYLDAANASAHLKSVTCASVSDPIHYVTIGAQPSLISLGIGQYSDISSGNIQASPTLDVQAGSLTVAKADISASTVVQDPAAQDVTFNVSRTPIPSPPPVESIQTVGTSLGTAIGNAIATLSDSLNVDVQILSLNILLQPVLSTLAAALTPILQSLLSIIGSSVLEPLLSALGVQLGGADVTVIWLDVNPTLLAI